MFQDTLCGRIYKNKLFITKTNSGANLNSHTQKKKSFKDPKQKLLLTKESFTKKFYL